MRRHLRQLRVAMQAATRGDRTDEVLNALGQLECSLMDLRSPEGLNEAEFKVFSQYGEDGAIQYLLRHVAVPSTTFVEIGVESYRESNTRFLAVHDNWRGLAIDGSDDHVRFIRQADLGWRADVQPIQAFVTRENINDLLAAHGYTGELGLLSIDVDGVDYWLFEAIEVVRPAIVVVEYNSIFGRTAKVTVPYAPKFICADAHWSHQYFGASLAALEDVAARRGYSLVGATTNAVNAFFVRDDLLGDLPTTTAAEAWRPSRFLSSRDEEGNLSFVRPHEDRLRLIQDLSLHDLDAGHERSVREIFGL